MIPSLRAGAFDVGHLGGRWEFHQLEVVLQSLEHLLGPFEGPGKPVAMGVEGALFQRNTVKLCGTACTLPSRGHDG